MIGYFIIRLGVDSEREIRSIDAFTDFVERPFAFDVVCKQVPRGVVSGDIAIVWLGTNNNKGGKTPWVQGIRALGRIEGVKGAGGYSSAKTVSLSIGVVLPRSVTKMDIVTKQSSLYPDIAAMPVLGVNNYSSQVVQRIEAGEPGQNLSALFWAIDGLLPGFEQTALTVYPDLRNVFRGRRDGHTSSESIESDALSAESTHAKANKEEADGDDGLDREEQLDSEIEVPFDPSKIDIIAKPMTISSLEDRLDNYELDLTPDFQRQANVWDAKRKARLIESILLKIPLPSFYFSEDADGGYAVVDGLQRLCAVFHFKNVALLNSSTGAELSSLRLQGLQYLKELEGKSFSELDRKFQRRISELEITANIIRASTPAAVKFNVFARLNQGGMPLNAQEIRNAIFPGEWRNELRRLAESLTFIKATDGKVQTTRQQDMELVLRYVALWQLGPPYHRPPNQTLDEFLNATVEHVLTRWTLEDWRDAKKAFEHAIDATSRVRGRHAFRKSGGLGPRKPINRGLFETELVVFGSLDFATLERAVARSVKVQERFLDALTNNQDFIQALLYATGSAEASAVRIRVLDALVQEAANA